MIIAENLTKIYNGIKVVDSVNFTINKGDIFGFIGPNGAGKTTTIGMMVGMIEPTLGKCYINEDDGKYRLTFIGETLAKNLRETDHLF